MNITLNVRMSLQAADFEVQVALQQWMKLLMSVKEFV